MCLFSTSQIGVDRFIYSLMYSYIFCVTHFWQQQCNIRKKIAYRSNDGSDKHKMHLHIRRVIHPDWQVQSVKLYMWCALWSRRANTMKLRMTFFKTLVHNINVASDISIYLIYIYICTGQQVFVRMNVLQFQSRGIYFSNKFRGAKSYEMWFVTFIILMSYWKWCP